MNQKSKQYLFEDRSLKFLDRNLWRRLGKMLKPYRWGAGLALACLIVGEFLPQFQPKLVKAIVDGPVTTLMASPADDGAASSHQLILYCLMFLGVVTVTFAFKYAAAVLSQTIALKVIHKLRLDLYRKVQGLPLDFFKRTPVGRLMTRLTNDVDSLNSMFAEGFIDLAGALLMLLFPLCFMLHASWELALITLLITPIMFVATSIFRVKVREINKVIRRLLAELNTNMQENLAGNHIVQLFGKTREHQAEFDNKNKNLRDSWLRNVKYYSYYFPVIHVLTEFSIVLLYLGGGLLFFRDKVSVGTLLEFSMYMGMFWRPLREISDKYTQLQTALAASERVFTMFDLKAELPHGSVIPDPDRTGKSGSLLAFHNVGFSYNGEEKVLKGISFNLREGESIAIVGATGSGKSTILSLCNGFYYPDSGRVTWGDSPLPDLDPAQFHKQISYVPQDVFLYSESIAFNVSLSLNPDMDRVREVCRHVNAHGFIEAMPEAYQTVLHHRGENLSTGQRQLLAFARALYHRPRLLLLDEATSSIDTETETLIQDALGKLTQEITSIVVAHRLSTIRSVNRILVLHKGEIRETGSHSELLRKDGIYAKLYQLQTL